MKQFKEYLKGDRLNEATRSPFSDSQIHKAFANAGLTRMQSEGFAYGGYSPRARTHVYAIIWANEEDDFETNDNGDELKYAVNVVWVYLGPSGKIEADVSPMPEAENLHIDTATKLAGQIAKKEMRSKRLNG